MFRTLNVKHLTDVIIPRAPQRLKSRTTPLLTQKRADFELFKLGIEIINRKEHLSMEGLRKILSIKASVNRGLSTAY